MNTSQFSQIGSPVTPGSGGKRILTEPALGQDTVYDGAHEMRSTSVIFGAKGQKWSSNQCYSMPFRSATPRPWQRVPKEKFPVLGPGQYEPYNDTHTLAASTSWASRGRSGPVGYPFDASRRSLPFRASSGRFGVAASRKREALTNADVFKLQSDARRESMARSNFTSQMQNSFLTAGFGGAPALQGLQPLPPRAITPGY